MNNPKLSLILATKDSISTIRDISFRCMPDWIEIICIDGFSTDGTYEYLIELKLKMPNFKVSQREPNGVYDALNHGLDLARGDFIGYLHSDDLIEFPVLRQLEFLLDQSSDYISVDLKQIKFGKTLVRKGIGLFCGYMPPHPSLLVRKSYVRKVGLFDTKFGASGDFEWMLRLACEKPNGVCALSGAYYTLREGGISNDGIKSLIVNLYNDLRVLMALSMPICYLVQKRLVVMESWSHE